MDARTCVIRERKKTPNKRKREESGDPCPLCSTALIVKSKLMTDLETIEDAFLGRVSPAEIVRIQFEFYEKTYKDPLVALGRPYVELSMAQLQTHFETHRVSKCKMLLDDVLWTHSTQQSMVESYEDEQIGENALKTWLQLSKHKHELLRALDQVRSAQAPAALLTSYEFNDI
jgi:hypothetical protein